MKQFSGHWPWRRGVCVISLNTSTLFHGLRSIYQLACILWDMALCLLYFLSMPTAVAVITLVVLGIRERGAWEYAAGNDELRCQTQVPLLDTTTTDRWLTFDSWQCSAPPAQPPYVVRLNGPLASYYSGDSCGERILVLSDCTADTGEPSTCTCGLKTWTYRIETNSWSLIQNENGSSQPGYWGVGSSLVTICKSMVLYISASQSNESSLWTFDGQMEVWSKRSLVGIHPPSDVLFGGLYVLNDRSATLSTSCECNYAIIGFSYQMDVVWKLACSDVKDNYVWKRMEAGHNRSAPQKLYPTRVAPSTIYAGTEEGLILVMSNDGLWKYHLYTNLWRHVNSSIVASSSVENKELAFYSYKDKLYVLLSVDFRQLKIYSFKAKAWTVADWSSIATSFNDLNYVYNIALTTDSSRVFLYSGIRTGCVQLLWELDNTGNHWQRTEVSGPLLSPLFTRGAFGRALSAVCFGDKLYVYVYKLFNFQYKRDLWVLHLITMSWTLLKTFDVEFEHWIVDVLKSIVLQHSVYLTFYLPLRNRNLSITGHDTKNVSWTLYTVFDDLADENLQRRRDYSVAAVNSSTFILYSGATGDNNQYFCDLWAATLMSRQSSNLQWTRLEQHCFTPEEENTSCSASESNYKSVVVNNSFILFRITICSHCYFDVWHYSLTDNTWTHAFVDGQNLSVRYKCIRSVASVASQLLVAVKSGDRYELWLYAVKTMSWVLHSETDSKGEFYPFLWRGKLFLFETDFSRLSYRKLVCPPGYSSPNILQHECIVCAKGFFSTGVGETSCIPCPQGLTTSSSRPTSSSNCSLCQERGNYCRNGQCRVFLENGLPRPFCQCSFGFSGNQCQDPKYILIMVAVTVFIVLIVYGLVRFAAYWKRKRNQERSLLHHVEELTSVWQISHDEITQMELIGAGGYGEVYRCRYRDMFVAMKILRLPASDSILWEFEREIKFMQTVRHPNIVLFLGAGRTTDGSPFLISEFVSRGSLRRLLDDTDTVMTTEMKVKFCEDVARGMNFLHSLTPPRVHGDLKSDNLLISETDTVKIADFGLGKQISSDAPNREGRIGTVHKTRRHKNSERSCMYVPLVELSNHDSPHALGASRWRAPELSVSGAKNSYRTPADVYRYILTLVEVFIQCFLLFPTSMHTHAHTNIYIHTPTYTYIHTYIHTYTNIYIHTYIHA